MQACTGSGKTLAYVVPVAERLRGLEEALLLHQVRFLRALPRHSADTDLSWFQVGAIIVAPTRELAGQIHTVAQPFLTSVPEFTSLLLVGGT